MEVLNKKTCKVNLKAVPDEFHDNVTSFNMENF